MTDPSEFVRIAAHRVVGSLSIAGPMRKHDLAANANASVETVQRALVWLRDELDAPITGDRDAKTWTWSIAPGWKIPVHELPRSVMRDRLADDLRAASRWRALTGIGALHE